MTLTLAATTASSTAPRRPQFLARVRELLQAPASLTL